MSEDLKREKLAKGWIHSRMHFEVLARDEAISRSTVEEHIKKIKKMDNIKVIAEKLGEPEKVENPPESFRGQDLYSQVAEIEILVSSLENLIYTVIFFGPSSIEIIEPREMKIGFDSAQAMANAVAEMMHRYAAAGGAGGIVINTK